MIGTDETKYFHREKEDAAMSQFRFSVGPWNVHTGADSYGPETRKAIDLETRFANFKKIGFDAVQFHDGDAVPNMK